MKSNKEIMNEEISIVNFNVVANLTQVAKKLEGSHLDTETLESIQDHLKLLSEYLGTTTQQTWIFSILFCIQEKMYSMDLSDIIEFLDISHIDGLLYKSDLDVLLNMGLLDIEDEHIRRKKKSKLKSSLIISETVSDQIFGNEPIKPKASQKLDIYDFVKTVSEFIEKRKFQNIDTSDLFFMVNELELKNKHLKPVSKLKTKLSIECRTLLYEVLNDMLCFSAATNMEITLNDIYDKPRDRRMMVKSLVEKSNKLFELEYIDLGSNSQFANDNLLYITTKGAEFFLEKDAELFIKKKKPKNVISYNDIQFKDMFYDEPLGKEIKFLTESLMEDNFNTLQERMSSMSLSKGVACIMYGAPGTGKTQSAYQLARATGRDLMQVDISQSKSMWFGESERKIKEIFDNYRKICKNSKSTPILLFNEADAILGKLQENSSSNVRSTENAIVNILLEEIERLDGILIATTNLQNNLDPAFERRFLFKVKFDSPSTEVKAKIWQNKLSWVNQNFAMKLANNFLLSGGEIDNIVRKCTMQEVLTGVEPTEDEIIGFCRNEKHLSAGNGRCRVGFPITT